MKARRSMTPAEAGAIFDRAVAERALAVLTLPQGNGWATLKSRFLERDRNGRFFVLDYVSPDGSELPVLCPGQYVGVSFRQSSRKILFATVVEARGHFVLDDQSSIPAIRYRWPQSLTELQRRAYYRTPVPPDMTLPVVLWPGGVTARPGGAHGTQTTVGVLADISCGGALVHLHQAAPPPWGPDDLLGAELTLPDGRPPIVVDARYRGTRADPSGLLAVAVQFLGLEMTNEGRHTLQRLAGCVQRLHRLTIAAGQRDLGF
jgi:c-di-GMP-binding flagellar brake protein YcgR